MTSIAINKTCGLAAFAKEAEKAGYINADGSVNLLEAQFITKKYGKLVAKNQLDAKTIKELNNAMQTLQEKYKPVLDKFSSTISAKPSLGSQEKNKDELLSQFNKTPFAMKTLMKWGLVIGSIIGAVAGFKGRAGALFGLMGGAAAGGGVMGVLGGAYDFISMSRQEKKYANIIKQISN